VMPWCPCGARAPIVPADAGEGDSGEEDEERSLLNVGGTTLAPGQPRQKWAESGLLHWATWTV
jgi:hypothetical protein